MRNTANKNQKSKDTYNLTLTERVTLAICVVVIAAAFALIGVFFMFSWAFFLIFITDLALLVSGKIPDATKRFALFVSVVGAILALLFIVTSHPWLFR